MIITISISITHVIKTIFLLLRLFGNAPFFGGLWSPHYEEKYKKSCIKTKISGIILPESSNIKTEGAVPELSFCKRDQESSLLDLDFICFTS